MAKVWYIVYGLKLFMFLCKTGSGAKTALVFAQLGLMLEVMLETLGSLFDDFGGTYF